MSDGAKFIKIFLLFNSTFVFFIADFILSFDSFTVISGNPTISNFGRPPVISVCISTNLPSNPISEIVVL